MSAVISPEPVIEDVVEDDEEFDEAAEESETSTQPSRDSWHRRLQWKVVLVYAVIPALALVLAGLAGYVKYLQVSDREAAQARIDTVQVATEGAVALLSYDASTVEAQLVAARDRLTGEFRDAYTSLTTDVVIPGSTEKQISSVVSVPAASSVSASANHAVVLVFVNQTITIGADPPTSSTSCVRVVLDRVDGRWLISAFDPV